MIHTAKYLAGIALILCACFAGFARAQNAPAAGQQPPPKGDAGTAAQPDCISDNGSFKMIGNTATYVTELENKCEQRIRCKIEVYVTGAKGAARSQGTLTLAPQSRGAAAKQSFVLKVKVLGGIAHTSRECRVF